MGVYPGMQPYGGYGMGAYAPGMGLGAFPGRGQGVVTPARDSGDIESQRFDTRKLFIAGINYETTDATFKKFFSSFGEVEEVSLKKAYDGSGNRGFGFVTFRDQEVADCVLAQAGVLELENRHLNVKLAIPPSYKPPPGIDSTKLFIGSLPRDGTAPSTEDISQYFTQFGEVENAWATPMKGYGFVTFKDENGAYRALAHGVKNGGHVINEAVRVQVKWPRTQPGSMQPGIVPPGIIPRGIVPPGAIPGTGAMGMGFGMYGGCFPGGGVYDGRFQPY